MFLQESTYTMLAENDAVHLLKKGVFVQFSGLLLPLIDNFCSVLEPVCHCSTVIIIAVNE